MRLPNLALKWAWKQIALLVLETTITAKNHALSLLACVAGVRKGKGGGIRAEHEGGEVVGWGPTLALKGAPDFPYSFPF